MLRGIWQLLGQTVVVFGLMALVLFLPAGTLAWPAGWLFFGLFLVFFLWVSLWTLQHNPGLFEERLKVGAADQPGWDRWYYPLLLGGFFAWVALMGLDAVRWHWSHLPLWLQTLGGLALLASFYLLFLTFRENSYLSSLVRVQTDRGHAVICTGPYRYVRHPMYFAITVFVLGTSLLLGSWAGLLAGALLIVLLARRAVLEERTLRQSLPGYEAYQARVRYHMLPYVW